MIKNPQYCIACISVTIAAALFFSCHYSEDPGSIQEAEKKFSVTDFDGLKIGGAFNVDVKHGNYFEVSVRGDSRNIDDMDVKKEGTTLMIRYKKSSNRRHNTYITIAMPAIEYANFTGTSDSQISGFYELENFDLYLLGSSKCQLDLKTEKLSVVLLGASTLSIRGDGHDLEAELSGASILNAFNFLVATADLRVWGASDGHVSVRDQLNVVATGASVVVYRGNPEVISEISGSSSVHPD
jgi:hypothetical protein